MFKHQLSAAVDVRGEERKSPKVVVVMGRRCGCEGMLVRDITSPLSTLKLIDDQLNLQQLQKHVESLLLELLGGSHLAIFAEDIAGFAGNPRESH